MNSGWDVARELASPFTFALIALLALIALGYVRLRRRRGRSRRPGTFLFPPRSHPFARGFDLLLDGRWQEAMEVLKEAVRAHPDGVLAYLELGKIVRRRGEPRRAARLFEHVLARPELGRDERVVALYELGLAYRTLGLHEDAVARLERALLLAPSHGEARRELRRTYEEMGRWEKAVAVERRRLKRGEATDPRTLAALRTQQGKVAWAAGEVRASAAHLRAALALDPDCAEAALVLGRLLGRQGKARRALRVWHSLAQRQPEFVYLAFRDMQAAFRQLHDEAAWERFLQHFTEQHPSDPTGQLALAEWYAGRGQPGDAVACLRRALDLDPLCREAHLALLALYRDQGLPGDVLGAYERLAQSATGLSCGRFRCRACGHTGHDPFWKCPACAVWATPQRLLPQPTSLPLPPAPLDRGGAEVTAPAVAVRQTAPQAPSEA